MMGHVVAKRWFSMISSSARQTRKSAMSIRSKGQAAPPDVAVNKVTLVMGRKRKADMEEPVPKRLKLRSALGEVNC